MKRILTSLILLFFSSISLTFSQTDRNGNPVFNSVPLYEESMDGYKLAVNYYTLKNNIENRNSSVFISDKPSLDDIESAAIDLPSEFFVIMKNQSVVRIILIRNSPSRVYFAVDPSTGEQKEFNCKIKGDISENRANEIIKEGFDPSAVIRDGKLYFNNKSFSIASNEKIKEGILSLIKKEKLNEGSGSGMKILSKDQLRKFVVAESKEGGKLDFFTEIKGHEYDGIQIKKGLVTTRLGVALYKWGRANYELGVNTIDDAIEFWEEFKGPKDK